MHARAAYILLGLRLKTFVLKMLRYTGMNSTKADTQRAYLKLGTCLLFETLFLYICGTHTEAHINK